jgi:acetyl-CoA acyltransferase
MGTSKKSKGTSKGSTKRTTTRTKSPSSAKAAKAPSAEAVGSLLENPASLVAPPATSKPSSAKAAASVVVSVPTKTTTAKATISKAAVVPVPEEKTVEPAPAVVEAKKDLPKPAPKAATEPPPAVEPVKKNEPKADVAKTATSSESKPEAKAPAKQPVVEAVPVATPPEPVPAIVAKPEPKPAIVKPVAEKVVAASKVEPTEAKVGEPELPKPSAENGKNQVKTNGSTQSKEKDSAEPVAPKTASAPKAPAVRKGNSNDRIAIVSGLRTPFQKQGTGFRGLSTIDLATAVVNELVERTEIDPREITLCVYGQVVPTLDWLNIAREVVLRTPLPNSIEAFSVSRACATSIQAMTSATEAILAGQHDCAMVGGADSMSDVPLGISRKLRDALVQAQKAKTPLDKLKAFRSLRAKDLVPPLPGFSKEPTTGQTMGEAAEKMAKENGISRTWQDEIAHNSHTNAARAWNDGTYAAEVMSVHVPPYSDPVSEDNIVRKDSTMDSYSKLKPAFDRKYGTITAGNSSPLTDGASALLLMRESKAKSLGYNPLGYIKSWSYAAVDPAWQLLMGPVFAAPKALDRAGLTLKDMDLVDMHEAFAAQVASNLQAMASNSFAREKLNRSEALGEIDPKKLNVNGGSIAIGHPFAATGGRMVLSTLRELKKRQGQHALLTLCAAGGLGAAVVLEVSLCKLFQ